MKERSNPPKYAADPSEFRSEHHYIGKVEKRATGKSHGDKKTEAWTTRHRPEKQFKESVDSERYISLTKGTITSDVDGSYTGVPLDGGMPVQDADDL